MGEFFRGWRRKIGVVTLVMACVVTGGWIRGQGVVDVLVLPARKHITDSTITSTAYSFLSGTNLVVVQREQGVYSGPARHWGIEAGPKYLRRRTSRLPLNFVELDPQWHWQMWGFGSCELPTDGTEEGTGAISTKFLSIPYWSIVIPPCLISAFLLLTRPRKSTPKKIPEPIAETLK